MRCDAFYIIMCRDLKVKEGFLQAIFAFLVKGMDFICKHGEFEKCSCCTGRGWGNLWGAKHFRKG